METIPTLARRSFQHVRDRHRDRLVVAAGLVVAWLAGSAAASGGRRAVLAVSLGCVAVGAPLIWALTRDRPRRDFIAIELPALLILMAELVFRQRDADSLASNPLDPAGLYRVACIGLALLFGCLALTSPTRRAEGRITTRPFRLYCGYVIVVFIGAPLSVNLPLTAYRGVELAIGVIVLAGAYRRAGREAMDRIMMLLFWFTAVSVIVILVEGLIMPGSAFVAVDSPFPIQLHGVLPSVSANGTGLLGATLGLWSLAQLLSPRDAGVNSKRLLALLTLIGFATLVLAQYRTGYIATVLGLLVLLLLRARAVAFWVIAFGLVTAVTWGGALIRESEPILERGANVEVISGLSGRLNYWDAAIPVWRESPLLGQGLLTASRFEVLAELGSVYTSSIHGTWVEALVGTGIIGVSLLAASFLICLGRALIESRRPGGRIVPIVLLSILLVRSITGPTFEVAGGASLLLLTIALLLRDPAATRSRDVRPNERSRVLG
jgi:O-antigen ligase